MKKKLSYSRDNARCVKRSLKVTKGHPLVTWFASRCAYDFLLHYNTLH